MSTGQASARPWAGLSYSRAHCGSPVPWQGSFPAQTLSGWADSKTPPDLWGRPSPAPHARPLRPHPATLLRSRSPRCAGGNTLALPGPLHCLGSGSGRGLTGPPAPSRDPVPLPRPLCPPPLTPLPGHRLWPSSGPSSGAGVKWGQRRLPQAHGKTGAKQPFGAKNTPHGTHAPQRRGRC